MSTSEAAGEEAERSALGEIGRLEAIFSTYRGDSEFSLWQETRGSTVPVSRDLAFVLAEAERWRAFSNGAFLPTV